MHVCILVCEVKPAACVCMGIHMIYVCGGVGVSM